jgi:hypothetical protein
VSGAGRKEVDFEDNTFDRKGQFGVWSKEELGAFVEKVLGILSFAGAPVASEGAALYNPMVGGVATSANAANEAVRAALDIGEGNEPMKQVGYFYEHGNRLGFADFGDTVDASMTLKPPYAGAD